MNCSSIFVRSLQDSFVALTRSLAALLFEVTPLDPIRYSGAIGLLALIPICGVSSQRGERPA